MFFNNLPKPIFCLAFNTESGVVVCFCCTKTDMSRPSPRGCSEKMLTAVSSTGKRRPTRLVNSQYAS